MRKPSKNQATSVLSPKALLERYACPLPYHQVRARFMGNIATPDMTVSPMQEIQRIWNNNLPVFESKSDAEAFFGVLLQGLWNALSAHQKRTELSSSHDLQPPRRTWNSWPGSPMFAAKRSRV